MSGARSILGTLGRDTLVQLSRERGLGPKRSNDERRASLARSFKGDVEELASLLTRRELMAVFRELHFMIGETEMFLPGATRLRKDELVQFAVDAFQHGTPREEFVPVEVAGDEDGEDDGAEEPTRDPFPRVGPEWTRPRMMKQIIRQLRLDVPERLRTKRFHEVLDELHSAGFEAANVDGTPVGRYDRSPGMNSKLRLRRRFGTRTRGASQSEIGGTVNPPPPAPREPPQLERPHAGPRITASSGQPASIPRPSIRAYEVAVLRLQLLTAVPSFERQHSPGWPRRYLEVSVRNLDLDLNEVKLLEAVAPGWCAGTHSPFEVADKLVRLLDAKQWDELLAEFADLNAMHGAAVGAIVAYIRSRLGPTDLPAEHPPAPLPAPPPQDFEEPVPDSTEPNREPRAASSRSGDSNKDADPHRVNLRSLGPLDDMFD